MIYLLLRSLHVDIYHLSILCDQHIVIVSIIFCQIFECSKPAFSGVLKHTSHLEPKP